MAEITEVISQILSWLGDNVPKLSASIVQKISEATGEEVSLFTGKIFTLLIFALVIFFSSRITNKMAKILVVVLSIILIISILYTFF